MDLAPAETALAGTCPLCQCAIAEAPEPRTIGGAIALLGEHFGSTCAATEFVTPRRSA